MEQCNIIMEESQELDPWMFIDNLLSKYDSNIQLEYDLLYQTVLNGTFLSASIGFSPVRDFAPVVRITSLSDMGYISFMSEEWSDFINNLQSSDVASTVSSSTSLGDILIFENFSIKFGTNGKPRYVHSRGQTINFCDGVIGEILLMKDLIQYRMEMLKTMDFAIFYNNVLSSVDVMLKECSFNTSPYRIIKHYLCNIKFMPHIFCMLECIDFHYKKILNDLKRLNPI